jgi:spermidine synthase
MAHEPVNFSELRGVRYLHLGSEWIQGAMRLNAPNSIELEYAEQMMGWLLFLEPCIGFDVLQLGLGTGTLSKFCHHLNNDIQVSAVEINPAVIVAAKVMFDLPVESDRMTVVQDDALAYVKKSKNYNTKNVIQVDLYDGSASGPALSSLEFYQGCANTLKDTGILTVNLFGRHSSFKENINNLCEAFSDRVLLFPEVHDCNVVAIAFKGPSLKVSWKELNIRANEITKRWGLPAAKWVRGIKKVNARQDACLEI